MPWRKSKIIDFTVPFLAALILAGCGSESVKQNDNPSFCLSKGEGTEYDCDSDAQVTTRLERDWADHRQFRPILEDITAPVLRSQPEIATNISGYTLQLAAFKTKKRMSKFLNNLPDHNNLYMIKRADGWHSVSYGFFQKFPDAKQTNDKLIDNGVKTWLRPIDSNILQLLKQV